MRTDQILLLEQSLRSERWLDSALELLVCDLVVHRDDVWARKNEVGDGVLEGSTFGEVAVFRVRPMIDNIQAFDRGKRYLVWCYADDWP